MTKIKDIYNATGSNSLSPFGGPAWGMRREEDPRFTAAEMGRRLRIQGSEVRQNSEAEARDQRASRLARVFSRMRGTDRDAQGFDINSPQGQTTGAQDIDVQYGPPPPAVDVPRVGNISQGHDQELSLQVTEGVIEKPAPVQTNQ